MTAVAVTQPRRRHRHARPRFQRARTLVSVRVPSAANAVLDRHSRFLTAALFVVVAVVWAVRPSAGWAVFAAVVAFVFGRGVGLACGERRKAVEDGEDR